ncbi:MAG: secondary thiamine-phosphate synthase enzyme YjbQ [bacterium]|nr:secondary thiamine-phosphate synthase enzyme YjbQ [bacterium]
MTCHQKYLSLKTSQKRELVDLTERIGAVLSASGLRRGIISVFTKHSTAGLLVTENESGLKSDFLEVLGQLDNTDYAHNKIDDNAAAHLISGLVSPSLTVPFAEGKLALGTWQSLFLVEADGPRPEREISVTLIGE